MRMMIDGWREDANEGPYDILMVRDDWEIFQLDAFSAVSLTDPGGERRQKNRLIN